MEYKEVIDDFNSGVLDKSKTTLVMDNDGGYWMHEDPSKTDDECEEICDELHKKYGIPNGYRDIVDVLNAAGVRCDWC